MITEIIIALLATLAFAYFLIVRLDKRNLNKLKEAYDEGQDTRRPPAGYRGVLPGTNPTINPGEYNIEAAPGFRKHSYIQTGTPTNTSENVGFYGETITPVGSTEKKHRKFSFRRKVEE